VNDPVDTVLAERAALERGFSESLLLSGFGHALLIGGALFAAWLSSRQPPIKVADGFAVSLPPGGYGTPQAAPAPPAPAPQAPPVTQPPAAKPEPPPKIIKPPQETPRKGLADPDAKRAKKTPERPAPAPAAGTGAARNASGTEGFSLTAPPGAGVPGGTDPLGDWYLAAVQRKIWMLWAQQVKSGMTQPATVSFTILANGSVADVQVIQSSGVYLIDSAAQRAVLSAAPFGPLPKDYGTNRITIQGIFKPSE
jgi:protein TonB